MVKPTTQPAHHPKPIKLVADRPALLLAPMEGVTDAPMRALLGARGGLSYCVAEFMRISQDVPGPKTWLRHVPELASQGCTLGATPVQVQLLGGNPEKLAHAAQGAIAAGAQAIDLNFGCPAKTVNRHDGGAALLREPLRIRQIVQAVRDAVPPAYPVSAKLRLGWEHEDDIHHNSEMAAQGGAAWITIHGRTRLDNYRPWARWRPIAMVNRRLPIPVVANGDIWSVEDLRRCQLETGCIHFMLGRGVLVDPQLPQRCAQALGIAKADKMAPIYPSIPWVALWELFARSPHKRPAYMLGRLKQWGAMTHRHMPNTWYPQIKRLQSVSEILATMRAVLEDREPCASAP